MVILTIFYTHGKPGEGGFTLFIDYEYIDIFPEVLFLIDKEIVLRTAVRVIICVLTPVNGVAIKYQRTADNNLNIWRVLANSFCDLLDFPNTV